MTHVFPEAWNRGYVAGVLHGDGWSTAKSFGLKAKDRDFVDAFHAAVMAITGVDIPIRLEGGKYWVTKTSNKTGKFNGLVEHLPRSTAGKIAWLRGLFDSDGSAQFLPMPNNGPNSYQRRIGIYSSYQNILAQAANYLVDLRIEHGVYAMKNSSSHHGKRQMFELRMKRREAFQAFARLIGSSIARKQATLDSINESFQPDGWQAVNLEKARAARYPHLENRQ